MKVFVTGATGWVGSAVVDELVAHGHDVVGLSRSTDKAQGLTAKGAQPLIGSLDDTDVLRHAAQDADAVIHTAFDHDFSRYAASSAQDERVIHTLGSALEGTDKSLIVTSTLAALPHGGRIVTETDLPVFDPADPRRSEQAAHALTERGVRVGRVRNPTSVHGVGEPHGFVPLLMNIARQKGVSAYIGDGGNHWPAVHVTDTARIYRLALETGVTEPAYHAVGDAGIPFRDIAAAIGEKLGLPVESRDADHFGSFAHFAADDLQASGEATFKVLGWRPEGPSLLAEIADPAYKDAPGGTARYLTEGH